MREIDSRNNDTLKFYASLSEKKNRDREGLYLAEGAKMFFEGARFAKLECALVRKGALTPEIERAARDAGLSEDGIIVLSEPAFDKLSDAKNPQGIAGVFRKPNRGERKYSAVSGDVFILDGISDPGNMGTLIRTAAASGTELFACSCTDPYSPKCVRSSMSGIFTAKLTQLTGEEILAEIARRKLTLCVADMAGENFFEARFPSPVAVVIGSEANGVSAFFSERAERTLSIPMDGKVESLNAAVCGTAMMLNLKYSRKE